MEISQLNDNETGTQDKQIASADKSNEEAYNNINNRIEKSNHDNNASSRLEYHISRSSMTSKLCISTTKFLKTVYQLMIRRDK